MTTARQLIPELAIVPLGSLHLHEEVDESRLKPLIDSLVQDGLLKNPPVVMPISKSGFVVLDGAHRTQALRRLGLSHVLVQVIRPVQEKPVVDTWTQVILDCEFEDLLPAVRICTDRAIGMKNVTPGIRARKVRPSFARLCGPGGVCWELACSPNSLETRASSIHALISACDRVSRIERATDIDEFSLQALFPELTAWVLLHPFTLGEIMLLAESGFRLPAGITRCMISPRALRVNYPLVMLNGSTPDLQRRHQLDEWLRERIDRRGVRYYPEPTYVFDE